MQHAADSLQVMDTKRRSLTILGLATSLVLAACGGAGTATTVPTGPAAGSPTQPPGNGGTATQAPGNGGTSFDACTLLTDQEIATATGFSPKSHAAESLGAFASGCAWELDNAGDTPWTITVGVTTSGGRAFYDRYVAPPVGEGEVIEGIGDGALQSDVGDVTAVKGDTVFSVLYIEFPTRDEVAVTLARAIAAKL
jgi:hypothetical protein